MLLVILGFQQRFPDSQVFHVRRGFVARVRCRLIDWCGGREEWATARHDGRPVAFYTPAAGIEIVAAHPVQLVTVTDKEPWRGNRRGEALHAWWPDDEYERDEPADLPSIIPPTVFGLIEGAVESGGIWKCFPTRFAAMTALSDAVIAWAKAQPRTIEEINSQVLNRIVRRHLRPPSVS